MRQLPQCAAVVVIFCTLGSARANAWVDGPADVYLTVFDQAVAPGESAALTARLEHAGIVGIRPNMAGYELRFHCQHCFDRCAVTALDGIATVEAQVPADAVSPCPVEVRFTGSPHHKQTETVGRVFIWPKDSRVLIADIDHTISDLALLQVPFTANERIPAMAGSVAALQELSRTYRIVYLSARDTSLYNKTRDWLQAKGFPEGPLFCRELSNADEITSVPNCKVP